MKSLDFVAFDLETTGKVAGVDQIVELGAVKFINGSVDSIYASLVDPKTPIPPQATAVNQITDEMVSGKPTIDRFLEPFAEFAGDFPLVAHNAPFDFQFLAYDIKKHMSKSPTGVVLDTLPLAKKVLPGLANYRLATLVQHCQLPDTEYHRAEHDAEACGWVFVHLVKKISVNGQLPEMENLQAMMGRSVMTFPQVPREPQQLSLL